VVGALTGGKRGALTRVLTGSVSAFSEPSSSLLTNLLKRWKQHHPCWNQQGREQQEVNFQMMIWTWTQQCKLKMKKEVEEEEEEEKEVKEKE
jgi:hypothetical protein